SVTKRLRTRATVFGLAPQAVTMASSACSSPCRASASKRMRAWVSLRAAALPTETNRSSSVRSSSVRVTRYFSMAEPLSLSGTSWPKSQETGFRVTRQSKIDKSLGLPAHADAWEALAALSLPAPSHRLRPAGGGLSHRVHAAPHTVRHGMDHRRRTR